jgi:hypothetical protein
LLIASITVRHSTVGPSALASDEFDTRWSTIAWAVLGALSFLALVISELWQLVPVFRLSGSAYSLRSPNWRPVVVLQLTACLLVGNLSFAFIEQLVRVTTIEPGFDTRQTVVVGFEEALLRSDQDEIRARLARYLATASSLPVVSAISLAESLPAATPPLGLHSAASLTRINADGSPSTERIPAIVIGVDPVYFSVLEMAILRGRSFTDADQERPVAILNETAALKLWGNQSGVDESVVLSGAGEPAGKQWTVIGVSSQTAVLGATSVPVRGKGMAVAYVPFGTREHRGGYLIARVRTSPDQGLQQIIAAIRAQTPDAPLTAAAVVRELIREPHARTIAAATLLGLLTSVCLAMCIAGLAGLAVQLGLQRRKEIGIRIALGAARWQIAASVGRQFFWLVILAGAGAIVLIAWWWPIFQNAAQLASPNVSATQIARRFLLCWLSMGAATLAAVALPVLDALRLSPADSLRET